MCTSRNHNESVIRLSILRSSLRVDDEDKMRRRGWSLWTRTIQRDRCNVNAIRRRTEPKRTYPSPHSDGNPARFQALHWPGLYVRGHDEIVLGWLWIEWRHIGLDARGALFWLILILSRSTRLEGSPRGTRWAHRCHTGSTPLRGAWKHCDDDDDCKIIHDDGRRLRLAHWSNCGLGQWDTCWFRSELRQKQTTLGDEN